MVMVEVIKLRMDRDPACGYSLNMKKSVYLMAPSNDVISDEEMSLRIRALMTLGIPLENIKIHSDCQPLEVAERRTEWVF